MAANSALSAVMDQAKAASDAFTPENLPTVGATPAPTALVPVGGGAARPSLDAMADSAGIQVDAYLSVKEAGLRIDKNAFFPKAKVVINIAECVPIFSVRANKGGATTFIKSYDGSITSQGQNFAQATAQLHASYDKVDGPYQTVEIPVTLQEDVPGAKKGQRLGITPAVTGVKFWTKFYNELRTKGLSGATVLAEIDCVPQSNKKGNDWGVVGFTLLQDTPVE